MLGCFIDEANIDSLSLALSALWGIAVAPLALTPSTMAKRSTFAGNCSHSHSFRFYIYEKLLDWCVLCPVFISIFTDHNFRWLSIPSSIYFSTIVDSSTSYKLWDRIPETFSAFCNALFIRSVNISWSFIHFSMIMPVWYGLGLSFAIWTT